ncbi:glycosyl hydrolase family 92-domain-containing protein [Xylaria nigripes]|nr:glycosyl hydrolase family 92-domain-containing protein [Xylaria nigripes]
MVETNIMIATNADIVLSNALSHGFRSLNVRESWSAVHKDAYEPPEGDTEPLYYDREPNTPYESESASRTLDYAFSDAAKNYNATSAGLSGNEDLGQMSAWHVFSALGFYLANLAGDGYVAGTPFFEKAVLRLPCRAASGGETGSNGERENELVISAPGAPAKAYVKGLSIDGKKKEQLIIHHGELVNAKLVVFGMSETPTN